jgi:uncharacterized protein YraI
MRTKTLSVVLATLAASFCVAGAANATPGYATQRLEIKAGPDDDYPTVGVVRQGSKLTINGCLRDWTWCDVTAMRNRGWVEGRSIQAYERGRRIAYGAPWTVPLLSFTFSSYWDINYHG